MLQAILILPFNVLITVPFIILWLCGYRLIEPALSLSFVGMILSFAFGFFLIVWTMMLFASAGGGSPAPWNPIKKLIITGPYAYVRNPMLSGVFMVLLGESLLFRSWALFYYLLVFIVINAFYFPLSEEKGLIKRFGDEYINYRNNVPRFIPRLRPWNKD